MIPEPGQGRIFQLQREAALCVTPLRHNQTEDGSETPTGCRLVTPAPARPLNSS